MADRKLTKSIGEHWVAASLARHGWAPALTRDGLERTDILAVATHLPGRPMIDVQVKTANRSGASTSWQLGSKAQEPARSRHEWFVLLVLPAIPREPEAFVVPRDVVAAAAWMIHRHWLSDPAAAPGKRNTPMHRARVSWEAFEGYRGAWELLGTPTDEVPVRLKPHWHDRAGWERVGLPPGHPWHERLPAW